ncbi:hypothetical protein ACRRTK_017535 [Alexandromys fortis]
MTQLFRALAALPEDLGLTPSTHMAAHNRLHLQLQRSQHPLLPLDQACIPCVDVTCRQNAHIHKAKYSFIPISVLGITSVKQPLNCGLGA